MTKPEGLELRDERKMKADGFGEVGNGQRQAVHPSKGLGFYCIFML